jgi:hypothetical protein
MSKWQTVIDELKITLEQITVVNGYNTDAGDNVQIWRTAAITDDTVLPLIDIRDLTLQTSDDNAGYPERFHYLMITITAIGNTSTEVREVLDDIITAINNNDEGFGLTDGSTSIDTIEMDILQEEIRLIIGTITLNVRYKSSRWAI